MLHDMLGEIEDADAGAEMLHDVLEEPAPDEETVS